VRDQLIAGLLEGRIAGPITTHDRWNVRRKLELLVNGDHTSQFGISGLGGVTVEEVTAMMSEEAGFDPDPSIVTGPTSIEPDGVLDGCEAAGRRLAEAATRGQRVLLATGHPVGLILLYQAVAELLELNGAKLLRPLAGHAWREDGHHREIQYLHGVAVLTDRGSTRHRHEPIPMEWMLQDVQPDLVFADHGFAGAAIERRIDTISIADVNDPALVVAKRLGMTDLVIVMDDNVQPEDYWPCFQAIAGQFPP
jgi:hypothetical protein